MVFMTLADVWSDWMCSVRIYSFSYQEATVTRIPQSSYLDGVEVFGRVEVQFQLDVVQLDVVQVYVRYATVPKEKNSPCGTTMPCGCNLVVPQGHYVPGEVG